LPSTRGLYPVNRELSFGMDKLKADMVSYFTMLLRKYIYYEKEQKRIIGSHKKNY